MKHSCVEAGGMLDRRWTPPNVLNSAESESLKHAAMVDANPIYQLISELANKIEKIENRLKVLENNESKTH